MRPPTHYLFSAFFLFTVFCVHPARAADIVALCIGNDAYARAEDVLDTPVADATLMKKTLEALPGGADVKLLTDASREEIQIALNSLVNRSKGAKLVLVFYSGHGLEGQPEGYARPDTFLLPVEATIPDVTYLPTRAVGLQSVLEALGKCPVTARAVILDCCRTGAPKATAALAGSTKSFGDIDQSVKDALGVAVVPEATLVAFASGPLRKAAAFLKQNDANSPFTLFIAESLATGTGNLRDLVEAAAEKTELATGRRQVPQVTYTGAASAIRQIVFRTAAGPPLTPAPAAPAQTAADRLRRATQERPFVNSLGLEFVPVPGKENVWMCRTETRVRDFRAYVEETDYVQTGGAYVLNVKEKPEVGFKPTWEFDENASWYKPGFEQSEDHALVCVNWEEARAMAGWLSKQESGLTYRLPTDAEWSAAVGSVGKYPWGNAWPPPNGAGNFFGKEWLKSWPDSGWIAVPDYDDGAEYPTRVGTYEENRFGFFDLSGNVSELCEDQYKSSMNDTDLFEVSPNLQNEKSTDGIPFRVVRGGSWNYNAVDYLRSSRRDRAGPTARFDFGGFRLVVEVGAEG